MSEQPTPGLWEVVENGEGQWADDVSDETEHPAYWIKGPRFLQLDWNMYAFTLEDARLIASAPSLLAACEAQDDYEVHREECPECTPTGPCRAGEAGRDYAVSLRHTAIAKAQGEEPR